jgi:hypothetical protein
MQTEADYSVDLNKELAISFRPASEKIRRDETLSFSLQIENRSGHSLRLHFLLTWSGGKPLDRAYYFEVYKVGRNRPLYTQPHFREGMMLSQAWVEKRKTIDLPPGASYREDFAWKPTDVELSRFERLAFRAKGRYRVTLRLNFDPKYQPHTPEWARANDLSFEFERE